MQLMWAIICKAADRDEFGAITLHGVYDILGANTFPSPVELLIVAKINADIGDRLDDATITVIVRAADGSEIGMAFDPAHFAGIQGFPTVPASAMAFVKTERLPLMQGEYTVDVSVNAIMLGSVPFTLLDTGGAAASTFSDQTH
jgi:hypothetical protein